MIWLVALTAAFSISANTYRQIDAKGVGNCIFATHGLPLGGEATYSDVRKTFTAPQTIVEHRCYFAKTLEEFAKDGKLENSLRDSGKYWSRYTIRGVDSSAELLNILKPWTYGEANAKFDQSRSILDPTNPQCHVLGSGHTASSVGCLDIEKTLRWIAGDKLPVTARVCVDTFYTVADVRGERWDEARKALLVGPLTEQRSIAVGCVDYTVN